MNETTDSQNTNPREGFSARILTDPQFEEAVAITDILQIEIHRSGTFKEKLGDYAHAFARTNKFDAARAESTLRDIFRARHGLTMNQMREGLSANEETVRKAPELTERVQGTIQDIETMVQQGEKITFARACEQHAGDLAAELGITNAGAKRLMASAFRDANDAELYDWGKELDERFYRPQIEAEKQSRRSQGEEPRSPEPRSYGRASSKRVSSDGHGNRRHNFARTGPRR